MSGIRRRELLTSAGLSLAAANRPVSAAARAQHAAHKSLDISDYQPKSMLHVKETRVERSRYPVIDIHTHLSFSKVAKNGVQMSEERNYTGTPQELLPVMDRKNLAAMVNLTGGYGKGLEDAIARYDKAFPGTLLYINGALLQPLPGTELSEPSGQRNRRCASGRSQRAEDPENLGAVSEREHHLRKTGDRG